MATLTLEYLDSRPSDSYEVGAVHSNGPVIKAERVETNMGVETWFLHTRNYQNIRVNNNG